VSKGEFKLFCTYTIIYAAMFDAFAKIDGGDSGRGKNDDKRIVEEEWLKGYKKVGKYGFVALEDINDKKAAKALFASMDDNGGGMVLLDEWCYFLKQAEVKANTTVGQLLALDEPGGVGMKEKLAASKARVLKRNGSKKGASFSIPGKKSGSGLIAQNESGDSVVTVGSQTARKSLTSLTAKQEGRAEQKSDGPPTPVAGTGASSGDESSAGVVENTTVLVDSALNGRAKQRFRDMCKYQHANENNKKDQLSKKVNGGGKAANELKAPGFTTLVKELLVEHGVADVKDADIKEAFVVADVNSSGTVDEGEFASLLQLILQGHVKGLGSKSLFFGPSTKLVELREAAEARYQALEESRTKPNAFGLAVGKSATKDFFSFAACFDPFAAATDSAPEGQALLASGFSDADPNGNGLCSLAELETFVLKRLLAMYPNAGKGFERKTPGKELFDLFRPCYIRAFHDAKDFKADSGATIKGTKKATDDDFVSKGEFKLFCTYTIIYAAMFDAFAKIDGGDSGRGKNDDKRIVEEEWLKGYKKVGKYGFVALEDINDKKAAKALFASMDDNGGGMVLLDEWCYFLKQAEVKANTTVGQLLALDEAGGVGIKEKLAASKTRALKRRGSKKGASFSSPENKSGSDLLAKKESVDSIGSQGLPQGKTSTPRAKAGAFEESTAAAAATAELSRSPTSASPAKKRPTVAVVAVEVEESALDKETREAIQEELKSTAAHARKQEQQLPGSKTGEEGGSGGIALATLGLAKKKFKAMALSVEESSAPVKGGQASKRTGVKAYELNAPAFALLVKEFTADGDAEKAPSDSDLKEAFALADKNKSGGIDEAEFLSLLQLILQGHVKDLSNTSIFFGPSTKLKQRRSSFQQSFKGVVVIQEEDLADLVSIEDRVKIGSLFDTAVGRTLRERNNNGKLSKSSFKKLLKDVLMGLSAGSKEGVPLGEEMEELVCLPSVVAADTSSADAPTNDGIIDQSAFVAITTVYLRKHRTMVEAKAKAKAAEKEVVAKLREAELEEAKEFVRRQKSKEVDKAKVGHGSINPIFQRVEQNKKGKGTKTNTE